MKNKKISALSIFTSVFVIMAAFVAQTASADSTTTVTTTTTATPVVISAPAGVCLSLTRGLFYGASDSYTNGDVAKLQAFLATQGYFNANATGFYGVKTFAAVVDFQRRNNISPIGLVGPITRARIQQISCGTVINPPVSNAGAPVIGGISAPTTLGVGQTGVWSVRAADPAFGPLTYSVTWGDENQYMMTNASSAASPAFMQSSSYSHAYSQAGTYTVHFTVQNNRGQTSSISSTVQVGGGQAQSQAPQITSVSPASGSYGTSVTITGTGFTRYNNSVNFAGVSAAASGVESMDGTTIRYTIPATPCPSGAFCSQVALANGTYPLSVTNQNGTSNQASFTLGTGSTGTVKQTITLSIGQQSIINGDLVMQPNRIVEDSRCPADVTCFTAGNFVVETQARAVNSTSTVQTANLSIGANNASSFVTSNGYTIRLAGVFPTRTQNTAIAPSEYVMTYEVTR